jgi:hypothetical protein
VKCTDGAVIIWTVYQTATAIYSDRRLFLIRIKLLK